MHEEFNLDCRKNKIIDNLTLLVRTVKYGYFVLIFFTNMRLSIMMMIFKENRCFRPHSFIDQLSINLMSNKFLELILQPNSNELLLYYILYLFLTNLDMFSKQSKEEVNYGKLTLDKLNNIQLAERKDSMLEERELLFDINDTLIPSNPPPTSNQYTSQQDFDIDGFFSFSPEINEAALDIIPEQIEAQQNSQESSQAFSTSEAARMMSNTSAQSCLTTNFQSETKKNQEKKPRKKRQIDDEDTISESKSKKNIIGYIAKKSIKVVLKKYRSKLKKDCQKSGISFIDFLNFYEDYEQKLYGPEKLAIMLRISNRESEQTKKMKSIFYVYFEKVLRRDYLIETVKSGKMADLQSYLCKKNKFLLYFAESIQES